jgi:DNA repair exonuclease SbcCD ATPase subunit
MDIPSPRFRPVEISSDAAPAFASIKVSTDNDLSDEEKRAIVSSLEATIITDFSAWTAAGEAKINAVQGEVSRLAEAQAKVRADREASDRLRSDIERLRSIQKEKTMEIERMMDNYAKPLEESVDGLRAENARHQRDIEALKSSLGEVAGEPNLEARQAAWKAMQQRDRAVEKALRASLLNALARGLKEGRSPADPAALLDEDGHATLRALLETPDDTVESG